MSTTLFLLRSGETEYTRAGRVTGRRDIGLTPQGVEQIRLASVQLGELKEGVHDLISSPLLRATQSAEIVAGAVGLEVARDPRLTNVDPGRFEGQLHSEVAKDPEYLRFVSDPVGAKGVGGESLSDLRRRCVSAVEQAFEDAPAGASLVVVTHASVIRSILAYYLGMNVAQQHRMRVDPSSLSILRFSEHREPPRVLAINHGGPLAECMR